MTPKPSPLKAIRAKCLDCNITALEVEKCLTIKCPLYPYRLGRSENSTQEKEELGLSERRDAE